MIVGKKYINNSIFYTMLKKHYCPECGVKLMRITVSKIVNSESLEAKNYNFSNGEAFFVGDVKFIWKEFQCPICKRIISIDEMKKIEKKRSAAKK